MIQVKKEAPCTAATMQDANTNNQHKHTSSDGENQDFFSGKPLTVGQANRLYTAIIEVNKYVEKVNYAGAKIGDPKLGLWFAHTLADLIRTVVSVQTLDD